MPTEKTGDAKKIKSVRKTPRKEKLKSIKFTAVIGAMKLTTRASNVTLVIPLAQMKQVSALMESRLPDLYLDITATIKKKVKKVKDGKVRRQGYRGNRRRERFNPYKARAAKKAL